MAPVWQACGIRSARFPWTPIDTNYRGKAPPQALERLQIDCGGPAWGWRRVTAGSPPSPSPTHNQQNYVHARKPHWKTAYGALWRAMSGWMGKRSGVPVLLSCERESVLMRMEEKPRPAPAAGLRPDQSIPSSAILSPLGCHRVPKDRHGLSDPRDIFEARNHERTNTYAKPESSEHLSGVAPKKRRAKHATDDQLEVAEEACERWGWASVGLIAEGFLAGL